VNLSGELSNLLCGAKPLHIFEVRMNSISQLVPSLRRGSVSFSQRINVGAGPCACPIFWATTGGRPYKLLRN
jgi:hypothetical protein